MVRHVMIRHFLVLFVTFFIVSCSKKTAEPLPEEEIVEVTFTVNPIGPQSFLGMGETSRPKLKDEVTFLRLLIFSRGSGVLIKEIIQKNTDADFGIFKFETTRGLHLQVVFIASDFDSPPSPSRVIYNQFGFITGVRINPITITPSSLYVASTDIFVDSQFPPHEEIVLKRTYGLGSLMIKDQIPLDISKIRVLYNSGIAYMPNGSNPTGKAVHEIEVTDNMRNRENTSHNFIVHTPSNETFNTDIIFECIDEDGVVQYSKSLNNISFETSSVTLLYGKLFDNRPTNSPFSIGIDTTWNTKKFEFNF